MRNILPEFIHNRYKEKEVKGKFKAITLFMDISGFTPMTERLMKVGKVGAETLSSILNNIFEPVIDAVYKRKGFVSGFAGDAFTAIFPYTNDPLEPIWSAIEINRIFKEHGLQKTDYGDFNLFVKLGLSYGEVNWGIVGNDTHKTFFFSGEAIDGCAHSEHRCDKMEIIFDNAFVQFLDETSSGSLSKKIELNEKEDSYYKMLDIREKEGTQSQTKKEIQLEKDVVKTFLPEVVFESTQLGEFRNIVSIFISFKELNNFDELNEFIGKVLALMDIFGGYFNSLDFGDKGSNMLIFFGAPISYETNIQRAIDFIYSLKEIFGDKIRAGIVFGIVYAGIVGSNRRCAYTCLGDTVNLSARFMMKADWGELWLSKDINDVIKKHYNIDELGKFDFKGKSQAIPVYSLLNKVQDKIELSFDGDIVGRVEELNKLKGYIQPIFEGKFSGITYVYGEAGIGKSRLVYELIKDYKDKSEAFILQTDSILRKSFNPFIYIFELYFNQVGEKTEAEKKAEFGKIYDDLILKIKELDDDRADEIAKELSRTESIIGALLNHRWRDSLYEQLDSKGRFENTIYAIKEFFKAQSLFKPVILFLEDLHIIDEDSLSVIEVLTRNIDDYPIALLTTSRYNDDGSKPEFRLDKDVIRNDIDVKNLPVESTHQFVINQLGKGVSENTLGFINTRSQGNPFYIEQFCYYLTENSYLRLREDGIYELSKNISDIPSSINAILISRIDRLAMDVKETAQVASVLGKEFDVEILLELINFLDLLLNKEKFNELVSYGKIEKIWSSLSEIKYIFQHALLHETIYEMQLKQRLRLLHKSAGEVMEKLFLKNETKYVDIANHYEKGDNPNKAKEYFLKAGDYLKSCYNNNKAVYCYDKYISYADGTEEALDAYLNKARVLEILSRWKDAETVIEKGIELAQRFNNRQKLAEFKYLLSYVLKEMSRFTESLDVSEEVRKLAEELSDNKLLGDSYNTDGAVMFLQGELDASLEYYQEALKYRKDSHDELGVANTLGNIGNVYLNKGKLDDAIRSLEEAIDLRNIIKDKTGLASNLNSLGNIYLYKEQFKKAVEYFEEAMNAAQEMGSKVDIANIVTNNGMCYLLLRKFNQALTYFNIGLTVNKELGNQIGISVSLEGIGHVHKYMGVYDKALTNYKNALKIAEQLKVRSLISQYLIDIGNVFYDTDEYEKAVSHYKESLSIKETLKEVMELGYIYPYLSCAYANLDKNKESLETALLHLKNIEEVKIYLEKGRTHLAIAKTIANLTNKNVNSNEKLLDEISQYTNLPNTSEAYFNEAIRLSEDGFGYIETLIPAYFEYGKYLYNENKNEKGLEKINKAKELSVKNNINGELKKIQNFLNNI